MKIGIDCRLWNETGIGRYVRNLVWSLAKIDKKNKYILFFKKNEYENVELPGKNFQKKLADIHWHSLEEQIKLPKILKKENLELVHFPYFSVPILYSRPYVITIHDLIINHFPTGKASTRFIFLYWLKLLAYQVVLFFAVKNAKRVIAVSVATKNEIIKHYKKLPNEVDVTLEGTDEKISSAITKGRFIKSPYFLYVGNAYPHKNLEILVKAFKDTREIIGKDIKLVLVGKQDFFYTRLKDLVGDLELSDDVLFYEKISDGGLANLYKHALALVSPSLMEGFGLPVLEAMSMGTTVAVSNIEVYKEICLDGAIYFDPKSIPDIRNVLISIANGSIKGIQEKKKQALLRSKDFSWEKMAGQTQNIYENCISL